MIAVCSVFAFATCICAGLDPAYLCYNQDIFREHVLYCIENKYIFPFPSIIEECPNSTVEHTITLYCLCRQPEVGGESMVQCDKCDEWYHNDCVSIPSTCNIKSVKWFFPN